MQNQSPMPCPSDGPEEIVHEYINLDTMPDEALASLVEIELPRLIPLFGLLPDIAICPGHQPGAPACAPPPGMDALLPEDRALSEGLRNAEAALIAQCERLGIGWTILRPTMIYGMGIDENLTAIARRAMRTRLFPYPLGRGLRQPVHVEDLAAAVVACIDVPATFGGTYAVPGGSTLPYREMVVRILKGEKPGDIASETSNKLSLHVNPGSAQKQGVTLPEDLVKEAAKVIE